MDYIIKELSYAWKCQNIPQLDFFIKSLNDSIGADKIICIAAGRMGYSIRAFAMRLMHIGLNSYFIGDTNLPRISRNSVLLFASVSGETATNLVYAQQAKNAGSIIFLITQSPDSSLAKLADHVLCINCTNSTQIMKTLAEQYTFILYDYIIASLIELRQLTADHVQLNHSILE